MAVTVGITWLAGILIIQKKEKPKTTKWILIGAILIDAGMLICLKDINFFFNTARTLGNFFGFSINTGHISFLAPLGISYYTLSLIGYLLDVFWGTQTVQKNPGKFLLFAGYYPLLTSGPIVRYHEAGEQLCLGHKFQYTNLCFGLQRILWGLFKKLVISERLAVIVNTIYKDYNQYHGVYLWIAMVGFVFQLYTDFSGCIDIVLGVSELFGIHLPENFDLPFASKTLSEFWRRWHITLGAWLRDYILYPILKTELLQKLGARAKKRLGKKLGKKLPVWLGLFVSWFLIGFWHGGAWNFIIGVGLFFWTVIVLGELFQPLFQRVIQILKINTDCFSWKLFQSLRTFFIFMIGLSFFRSYGGFQEGLRIFRMAFTDIQLRVLFDGSLLKLGLDSENWKVLIGSLLVLACCGSMRLGLNKSLRKWLEEQNLIFRWLLLLILILSVVLFGIYGPGVSTAEFIYKQF